MNELAASLKVTILSQYPEILRFSDLDPFEDFPLFSFIYTIDIRSSFLLIDLNCGDKLIRETVEKIGSVKILSFINEMNANDFNGVKILWKDQEKSIVMRMNRYLFCNRSFPKDIAEIIMSLKSSMKTVLQCFFDQIPKEDICSSFKLPFLNSNDTFEETEK